MAARAQERLNRPEFADRGAKVDYADALAATLRERIGGEVRFDRGSRALYATDASNYREVPIGVVVPRSVEDVVETVAACREFGAPLLPRGGGTSLAGQCCNVAVVMDFSKYLHHIIDIDAQARRACVQPGCVLDRLRDAAEQHHLTFAPDPSTHNHNTLGGMIGNNSCGVHSVMGGRTADNVEALDVITSDGVRMTVGATGDDELEAIIRAGGRRGEIYGRLKALRDRYADQIRARYPKIPRRVSGYNLDELLPENGFQVARALVGSEGTCVTVLEAQLRLVPSPPARTLLVLGYPDVYAAGDHVPQILGFHPVGLEGIDDRLIADMKRIDMHPKDVKLLPDGKGWLLVEFGGENKDESDAHARACMEALRKEAAPPSMKLFDDKGEEERIWLVRESGLGATAHLPGRRLTWEGWEDAAVPPDRLGSYLRQFRALLQRFGYHGDLYGHFGDGCVHTRIDFDLRSEAGIAKYRAFIDAAADLVVAHGGSLSGEHGDGQSRAALLGKMYGQDLLRAFAEFKSIWDPDWRMNPGKVVHPNAPTSHLRLGEDFAPPPMATYFGYRDDGGNFTRAMLRCVGIGNCRREHGGTMCPSYQATREEEHSTRGRARLLFEMLRGSALTKGWRSEAVRESLDLCLSCKGCKGDCPVNVDMATYKAEFLAHYYRGRLRPRAAYSMGRIQVWSRLAALLPRVTNYVANARWSAPLLKRIAGIAPDRAVPRYAQHTFRAWFAQRARTRREGPRVLLWPDTFVNYFDPDIGVAAVAVLEHAGCSVELPRRQLCCGRPLYDFGLLDAARRYWRDVLDALAAEIDAGTPLVGLEPACVTAFRDELVALCGDDERARKLAKNTHTLAEYLCKLGYEPNPIDADVLVHVHCHQRAVLGFGNEKKLLDALGVRWNIPSAGCCGMSGSFGFERGKADLSRRIGEQTLMPAFRNAPAATLLVADGFSCREQIRQATGRSPLHIAQLLRRALPARAAIDMPDEGGRMNTDTAIRHGLDRRPFAGRVVVITGASAGVGRAAARAFARAGADVALLARGSEGLEGARREVQQAGGAALALQVDVADAEAVERAAQDIEEQLGPIEVWVNNAMVTVFAPVSEIDPLEFKRVTEVTYLGGVYGTMAALKRMRARNRGTIVQVSSALAFRSIPLQSAYCGAKHALAGFIDTLRSELEHERSDVHVTSVQMPALNTPQFDWARNKMPHRPQPVPPIFEPEVAAEAIVWAAQHRRRTVAVGAPTLLAKWGQKFIPGLLDRYLAHTSYAGQQTAESEDPERPDNLFSPVAGDAGAHGRFDRRAKRRSTALWLVEHRNAVLATVAAVGAALALWPQRHRLRGSAHSVRTLRRIAGRR